MRSPGLISMFVLGLAMFAFARAQVPAVPHAQARADAPLAMLLDIKGPIGPATSRFVEKGLQTAQARKSRLVILQIDTPGGLDTAMRDIIRGILASQIPVVAYVAPSGARAASAGAYILYACHVAAMAPATNVGAATPVQIGGEPPKDRSPAGDGRPAATEPSTAMERKVVNDSVAYIRSLAELRGRNADWAEQAVRGAASLSAAAALKQNVIEVIARDIPELLAQLNGRQVKIGERALTLSTTGAQVERIEPDWRTELLSVLTNPTIAYGLLLIGIYGLLLEGYNPGAVLPGVVGAISLLLALFAFQILSVNYAGLALVALGIAMIIAEFFIASFGVLGLGGLISFVVGSIILLDTDVPGLDIATPVIAGIATVGGLVVFGIAYIAGRSLRRPVTTGPEAMIGAPAEALEPFDSRGLVRVGGELWNAYTSVPVAAGQRVRVVKVQGLSVWVEPL